MKRSVAAMTIWAMGLAWALTSLALPAGPASAALPVAAPATAASASGSYTSLAPSRLLDTRTGVGAAKTAVAAGGTVHLQVAGRGGVPASGISAVVLNVTVTAPTRAGYLRVYGDGGTVPSTSNLNFLAGQTVPVLVVAPVGAGGKVALYNGSAGTTQILADVSGYFLSGSPNVAGALGSLTSSRLLDTRSGVGAPKVAVAAGGTVHLQVAGRGGVPTSGVSAVVLNVTVTAPTKPGFLTVYGDGTTRPDVSNLNFLPAQTVANLVIAPVGAGGKVALYNGSAGTAHVLADVSGYYLSGPQTDTGAFASVTPSRLLDTRTGVGAPKVAVAAGGTVHLQVDGRGQVPASGVGAVVLNVTATAPAKAGFVSVYADGTPRPGASNLNFAAGQTVPNLVIAPVGANGQVALYNGSGGTVQLTADVSGWFSNTTIATPSTATVTNFNPGGQQVTKFDTDGNGIDAHDGDLSYFGGLYYLYGSSYSCGYQLLIPSSPFCGFKSYSSPDLVNWTDNGFLFDATTAAWQRNCAPPRYGCYRPHVLYNSSTAQYVLWINSYDSASGYHVFTASTPAGPYTEQAQPVLANEGAPGSYVNGDFDLFLDDDGSAYINYSFINVPTPLGQSDHILKVQKLNSTYTSGVGTAINPGATRAEALSLTKKDGTYYMIYGPTCAYCSGANTLYKTASNVLGTWSAAKTLNTTSCGGQASFVAPLPTAAGGLTYVYGSDLWNAISGQPIVRNQGLANYYWTPLSISGSVIRPFGCSNTVKIDKASSASGQPNLPADLDQTSGTGDFRSWCDLSGRWTRAQGFTAGRSGTLTSISIATFQQGRPNAGFALKIYPADAKGAPTGSPLYTQDVPATSIGWSPTSFVAQPNITVRAGTRYAIVVAPSNTTGCYGVELSDANPYAGGAEMYLSAAGVWTAETNRDLKFLTTVR
jgi:hypothetical protein